MTGQRRFWAEVFKTRKRIEIPRRDAGEIKLDRVGERLRLSVDQGAERTEIGEFLCIGLALLLSGSAVHAAPPPTPGAPVALDVHVLKAYPHDPEAFTQGLLLHNGTLYESTGRYGVSDLRAVERDTGRVLRSTPLSTTYFGEGLALVGERLIQLTLREHVAFEYDLSTFRRVGELTYTTPGWGLCYDGTRIVMSDGSDTLYFRDPVTFAVTGRISVTLNGRPSTALNELECVGDAVFANVWQTDTIVKIDPHTGAVTAIINASGLLTPAERAHANVLNGIAYDAHRDTFLITGKLWPKLFEVQFVPRPP